MAVKCKIHHHKVCFAFEKNEWTLNKFSCEVVAAFSCCSVMFSGLKPFPHSRHSPALEKHFWNVDGRMELSFAINVIPELPERQLVLWISFPFSQHPPPTPVRLTASCPDLAFTHSSTDDIPPVCVSPEHTKNPGGKQPGCLQPLRSILRGWL